MSELIAASVAVGDRTYRIKMAQADEEAVRKTVKIINEKIIEFKTHFAGKDMQDYIAMVLLWFATDQVAKTKAGMANEQLTADLKAMEQLLDNQLKEN